MDTRDLVERITEEVVARLAAQGLGAEGPGAAPAAAAAVPTFRDCAGCTTQGQCASVCGESVDFYLDVLGADRVTSTPGTIPAHEGLAGAIDHTLLKPTATESQIVHLCEEAKAHGFASVCVNPTWVALCSRTLMTSRVKTCTVVGFPLGANVPEVKGMETRRAVADGAGEIDMVINIGALKSGDYELVERDIRAVVTECPAGVLSKVIIEAAYLTDEEKVRACILAQAAGASYVKTSTGFGPHGATVKDVRLMSETVGKRMGVKAAGGVSDRPQMIEMLEAGATRIGASAGVKIIQGETATTAY